MTRQELIAAIEAIEPHDAGAEAIADVSWHELDRLRAENAELRSAIETCSGSCHGYKHKFLGEAAAELDRVRAENDSFREGDSLEGS